MASDEFSKWCYTQRERRNSQHTVQNYDKLINFASKNTDLFNHTFKCNVTFKIKCFILY
jgi:hypothetical protein